MAVFDSETEETSEVVGREDSVAEETSEAVEEEKIDAGAQDLEQDGSTEVPVLEQPEQEPQVPVYLRDDPPPKDQKGNYTKWALMHGIEEDQLVAEGFHNRSVYICAKELEDAGLRNRVRKIKGPMVPEARVEKRMQVFAKGSPPEALIEGIRIPLDSNDGKIFEQGFKAGAQLVVLGVRIAQELSGIGVQQAQPLIAMARDMRQGEAEAARTAASEAAMQAAQMIGQEIGPVLAKLSRPAPDATDPMKSMMVRIMEPMLQKVLSGVVPGAQAAPGWSVEKE